MPSLPAGLLYVALGGALGAMARYGLGLALQTSAGFPWGTLTANLAGCLAMGALVGAAAGASPQDSGALPEHYRLLFAVGFCGSFTTLSAFVFEVSALVQRNEVLASFAYVVATLAGGFAAFWLGVAVTRTLWSLLSRGSP